MLINKEKKEELIKNFNLGFRTILSYGNGGLIPVGEFIVTDIIEDDAHEEDMDLIPDLKFINVVLTKVDDENVQIVMPLLTFLDKYAELAKFNADKLGLGSDLMYSVRDVVRREERIIKKDEDLEDLVNVETIPFEECGAHYFVNGEEKGLNYSICPVDIGKYMEMIRERIYKKDKKKTELYNYVYNKVNRDDELKIEPKKRDLDDGPSLEM